MEESAILKILPTVNTIIKNLPPRHVYIKSPVVIFRATENFLLILLTRSSEASIHRVLEIFMNEFAMALSNRYAVLPNSILDLIKFGIFSVARQAGPEPIGWLARDYELDEKAVFKYSLSSMMVLMNEVEGAKHRILNFHPFIGDKLLGMIFLFQIPLGEARGGAFDATILVTADFEDRAIIYQHHNELERVFTVTADEFISTFQGKFGKDIQYNIQRADREPFNRILEQLNSRLNSISIGYRPPKDIKLDMMNSISKLSKLL